MSSLANYCLYAFVAVSLCGVASSQVESQDTCSVCVVKDAPTQCGAFVHAALHPLYEGIAEIKRHLKTQHLPNTSQAILNRISDQQSEMTRKMERQMTSLEEALSNKSFDFPARMDKMEGKLAEVAKGIEIDLITIKEELSIIKGTTQPTIERIGQRDFLIADHIQLRWTVAKNFCSRQGGFLASIQSEQEWIAILGKLNQDAFYWLGTHSLKNQSQLLSDASGEPESFLKWGQNKPMPGECVAINDNLMDSWDCESNAHIICQIN